MRRAQRRADGMSFSIRQAGCIEEIDTGSKRFNGRSAAFECFEQFVCSIAFEFFIASHALQGWGMLPEPALASCP